MKLEEQVVSCEIAKRLKELGVEQESLWYWFDVKNSSLLLGLSYKIPTGLYRHDIVGIYSAYTVAELGRDLPKFHEFKLFKNPSQYHMLLDKEATVWHSADTEANARGKMLIHLLETNQLGG